MNIWINHTFYTVQTSSDQIVFQLKVADIITLSANISHYYMFSCVINLCEVYTNRIVVRCITGISCFPLREYRMRNYTAIMLEDYQMVLTCPYLVDNYPLNLKMENGFISFH